MTVITNYHLNFLEEAKQAFIDNPLQETYRNADEDLIALRYGMDRDCVLIYELGDKVAFFAQQIEPVQLNQTVIKKEGQNMMFQVKDKVKVLSNHGNVIGEGVIVSINEFREPQFKYAVDADFMYEDYIFVGEENLVKIKEDK